jgi:hypothetical protein
MLARQVLHHLSHSSQSQSFFGLIIFQIGSQTVIFLLKTLRIAEIIGLRCHAELIG